MSSRTRLSVFAALATLLAGAALGPVFDGMAWLLPVTGGIAVVAGIGELGRRLRVSPAITPVLVAAGVLAYVTALFARRDAVALFVPGPAAARELRGLVAQGFGDIRVLAPPVPTNAGIVLITVVGIAAVALVVDLLAVTLRRAALAGLPLLALFAVPAAVVPEGVGWLPFLLGGGGYLALLLADGRDRLGRWGRPLGAGRAATAATPDAVEYAETSPLAAVGRRIGVAALGIAVVVPALVPGLHSGLLGSGSGGGLPTDDGVNTVATYNPIARLKGYLVQKDPKELMRVTTSDPDPGYLRMAALDVFDGTTWSESALPVTSDSRFDRHLPAPDGLTRAENTKVETTIKVRDLDVHWLPVPYPATYAKVRGWHYDKATATIFSTRASTRRMTYSVVSRRVSPSPAQLRRAPKPDSRLDAFRQLPADLPDRIHSEVDSITAKEPDRYSRAVAIQSYFRTGFKYDISVPAGNSDSDLVNFINGKTGYCEQFAAAMAIFARLADIPARVAIGFTRGERQPDGSWRVTTADAHAWPELYFEGAGWLRFEPSPLGEGRASTPRYTTDVANSGTSGTSGPSPTATPGPTDVVRDKLDRGLDDDVAALPDADAAAPAGRGSGPPLRVLVLALVALALAVFPSLTRAVTRRRRWSTAGTPAEQAHAAWSELRDDAGDLGHQWSASDSPRAAGAALIRRGGLTGAAADAVRVAVRAEERARYAQQPVDAANLRAAVAQVRTALLQGAGRGRRWQARLVPLSSLRLAGVAAGAVGEALDTADIAGARLRRRLTRRRSTA